MSKIPFLASPVIASVLLSTSSARLNVGDEKKLKENVRVIDGHVMGIIPTPSNKKAGHPAALADKGIVSIVLDNIESRGMPVERNIAVASIIAGRDTTADCMGWLFHLLGERGKNPKFSTDKHYTPTVEDITKVPHIFPDGTFVPANTDISIGLFSCRRLASVWGEDALEFKPERFIDNETSEITPMTATKFAALSAGPRIVIASIVARFEMIPEPGQNVAYTRGISLGNLS
ncbi:Cytochrome P450 [Phytophthora cactorum]|nr:Cytochrome P450 [Phytophthora cactorum]